MYSNRLPGPMMTYNFSIWTGRVVHKVILELNMQNKGVVSPGKLSSTFEIAYSV
jgi:hypothetical protein